MSSLYLRRYFHVAFSISPEWITYRIFAEAVIHCCVQIVERVVHNFYQST